MIAVIRAATVVEGRDSKGVRAITANTALRLARYFSTSDRFWLNLQSHYDLECERDRLQGALDSEVQLLANAD